MSDVNANGRGRFTRRRAAVMADVARLAGVSHQTVSRVLNDPDQVRQETRVRVEAAMEMLDYRPNSVARALVTGQTRVLGVVSFDTTQYGPASTLFAVERAAHEAGYHVSIASARRPDPRATLDAVERFRVQGVDGILVIAPQAEATLSVLSLPDDVAVVAVEAGPEDGVPVVTVDHAAGAVAATRHLLELGHATAWHIAGPANWAEARARVAGWREALAEAGAIEPPVLEGDWSARSGYELGRRLLAAPGATAVFVANDQMALGLLRVMHEAGRAVPDELSVVGFDDQPEASFFNPPLTTIRQDFMEMGRRGLELLLEEIEHGGRTSRREMVAPELVVRASTGPARG